MAYLLCQEPGQGQRVSVGRIDGQWYVRILGPAEVRQ